MKKSTLMYVVDGTILVVICGLVIVLVTKSQIPHYGIGGYVLIGVIAVCSYVALYWLREAVLPNVPYQKTIDECYDLLTSMKRSNSLGSATAIQEVISAADDYSNQVLSKKPVPDVVEVSTLKGRLLQLQEAIDDLRVGPLDDVTLNKLELLKKLLKEQSGLVTKGVRQRGRITIDFLLDEMKGE